MPAEKKPAPESIGQAEAWQAVCRNAEKAGLCPRCAAQLAWGAQEGSGGFSSVHAPCAPCTIVMLEWPVVRANSWRTPRGKLSSAATWAEAVPVSRTALPVADSGGV